MPNRPPRVVRQELYDKIVQMTRDGISRYYAEYPEYIGDDRANEALEWSLRGIARILHLLDDYDIRLRPPGTSEGQI